MESNACSFQNASYMGLYGGLDVDDIHTKKGVEVGQKIERAFISLQKKKVIERIGSKRDGSWIVIKQSHVKERQLGY